MTDFPLSAVQGRADLQRRSIPNSFLLELLSSICCTVLFSPLVVEKWKKWHSVPLLGIPNCVGFGLHADSYR